MTRIIEVIVSPKGETQVQTKGFAGGECLLASKFLEEALGVAASERKTSEFFAAAEAHQQVNQ